MIVQQLPTMARLWSTPRHGDLTAAWSAVIATAPDLAGAACRGSTDWDWDPREASEGGEARDARLAAAARTCASCPVLQQCAAYRDGLSARDRPVGVMAGEVILPPAERRWLAERDRERRRVRDRRRAAVAATGPPSAPARANHTPDNRTPATAPHSPDNHQEESA